MNAQPDLFDICARNHRDHPMSAAAHKRTNAEVDRERVMSALFEHGGMTCDELEIELEMSHQTCSARVSELKRLGSIREIGKRPTRTGCMASVVAI